MELFLVFCLNGIIAGTVYLAFCFIRRLVNYNLFVSIPLDIITGGIIGFIFFYCVLKNTLGEIRLYLVLGFVVGILITIETFKNFVASLADFVYNKIRWILNRLILKTKRRKANDGGKVNQDC